MGLPKTLLLVILTSTASSMAIACSDGQCKLLEECSSDGDCAPGLYCYSCLDEFWGSRCIRSTASNPFELVNDSLPFNKYAFLATHNSFAIKGEPSQTGFPRLTFDNQEDTVTEQLNNGVRALMLDTYEFEDDIWLCHSFGGKCYKYTAFEPLMDTLKEIEAFLSSNPTEIVTLILEDYVETPNALMNVFEGADLLKFWFPVSAMPRGGRDWPLVHDMIANNQRLLVFTSKEWKEEGEGIAYQWNFIVENQYGNGGMGDTCSNREESAPLDDTTKALVFVNYFRTIPIGFSSMVEALESSSSESNVDVVKPNAEILETTLRIFGMSSCRDNSEPLADMLVTCHAAAANRWANFVAVDYYKRSGGGGAFYATDMLNGELICGRDDVHACKEILTKMAKNTKGSIGHASMNSMNYMASI